MVTCNSAQRQGFKVSFALWCLAHLVEGWTQPGQLNGNAPILEATHRFPLTICNKSASTQEKNVYVFLDRKVLSPCPFVEMHFSLLPFLRPPGISEEKGATW